MNQHISICSRRRRFDAAGEGKAARRSRLLFMEAFLLPILISTPILHAVNPNPGRLSHYMIPCGQFLIVCGRREQPEEGGREEKKQNQTKIKK